MSTRVKEYGQTRSQLVVLLHLRDNHLINTQLNEFRAFHCGSERAKRTDALKKPQSQWLDNEMSKYRNMPSGPSLVNFLVYHL